MKKHSRKMVSIGPATWLVAALLSYAGTACGQKGIDTFHFYFDLNVSKLSKNMERKMDLLIYNGKIINGSEVKVIGYTDYLGSDGHNKALSMARAKNIKNYLVKYGIEEGSIRLVVGKGEIKRQEKANDKEGNPEDRKVDVVVNNNFNMFEKLTKPGSPAITSKDKTDKNRTTGNATSSHGEKTGASTTGKTTSTATKTGTSAKGPDISTITTLKKGQTILLKNVYFSPGSHVIKDESFPTLEKLFQILVDNPALHISIEGHVCCIPTSPDVPDALDIDTNEPNLSINRARSIYNYLVEKGVDAGRLRYEGFGKRHPIVAFERTEEEAEQNRRVEIRILDN